MATLRSSVAVMSDGSLKLSAPSFTGELWYLKNYFEIPKLVPGAGSNFCALTLYADPKGLTGGQTCWVELNDEEIELLLRVNNIQFAGDVWHYLVGPDQKIYRTINGQDPDIPNVPIHWPRIAIGSKGDDERNQVLSIGRSNDGLFTKIAGIAQASNYDDLSPSKQPWLFHRVYCSYNNEVIGDTPKGVLYMPILDPASGYKISAGDNGLWIPTNYLHSKVGTPVAPSPYIVHELLTVTNPRPMVVHFYYIDLAHVVPFVNPYFAYKLTPSQFLAKYGLDLVINGDGGSWLSGALLTAGRWMYQGKWISQQAAESSIWFDRNGQCKISYSKPLGFSPWNVISGPKQMIYNGTQIKDFDDTFVAARSAFGLRNTEGVVIAIEGQEFTDVGATEQDLAHIGMSIGLQSMIELDSGGSTSVAQRNGVSYSVEERPVLNVLGFKAKN